MIDTDRLTNAQRVRVEALRLASEHVARAYPSGEYGPSMRSKAMVLGAALDFEGRISKPDSAARISDLLRANNREIERRRLAEKTLTIISLTGLKMKGHPKLSDSLESILKAWSIAADKLASNEGS